MAALYYLTDDMFYIENINDILKLNEVAMDKYLGSNEMHLEEVRKRMGKYGGIEKIEKIILAPTREEVVENLANPKVAFMGWTPPEEFFLDVLVVKKLPRIHKVLNTQEMRYDVTIRESLEQKLGLEVVETDKNYSNLAGAVQMKQFFKMIVAAYERGSNGKTSKLVKKITVFLLGIPGAGKTYLAECIAGEFGYLLVKLDLSKIMRMSNPIHRLHFFFNWVQLLAQRGEYLIVLLDEIAQALNGDEAIQKQFIGQLLTIVEDLNTSRGYQVGKTMFIATENNIRKIMEETPQFMARWVESFFINFPVRSEALAMFKMYLNIYEVYFGVDINGNPFNSDEDIEIVYRYIEVYYRQTVIDLDLEKDRFVYSPREIDKFCAKLAIYHGNSETNGIISLNKTLVVEMCALVPAQQNQLKVGITKMINDAGKGFITI